MNRIHVNTVGFIERKSINEEDKDRSLKTKILLKNNLTKALMGITDFFHIYMISWMDRVKNTKYLHHPSKDQEV